MKLIKDFIKIRLSSLEIDLNEIKEKINKLGDEKSKLKEISYSNKAFAQEDTAPKTKMKIHYLYDDNS